MCVLPLYSKRHTCNDGGGATKAMLCKLRALMRAKKSTYNRRRFCIIAVRDCDLGVCCMLLLLLMMMLTMIAFMSEGVFLAASFLVLFCYHRPQRLCKRRVNAIHSHISLLIHHHKKRGSPYTHHHLSTYHGVVDSLLFLFLPRLQLYIDRHDSQSYGMLCHPYGMYIRGNQCIHSSIT